MYLEKITLNQFKNYEFEVISFPSRITFIAGENGSGKTNLLDAIYYCCLTKSAFTFQDKLLIKHECDYFSIISTISKDKEYEANCGYMKRKGKFFKINKMDYDRISNHLGLFPVVIISPLDSEIIREGSEVKRKFIDNLICQVDSLYLSTLQKYNHYLKQRNSALKMWSDGILRDKNLIQVYDKHILSYAKNIYKKRSELLLELKEKFDQVYKLLSSQKEDVSFTYSSQASNQDFEARYYSSLEKDIILNRTNVGVHKDSLIFEIGGYPIKGFGSQGQQKTFIVSLKLAQYFVLKKHKNVSPFLLLDDIFDKLDDKRIKVLLEYISSDEFGQVFITDARKDRLVGLKSELPEADIIEIRNGKLI